MGFFDGLIAKVEGEVTSLESRAAGLFTSKAPTAPASTQYEWQGPLQPGKTAPPIRKASPTSAPKSAPASTFDYAVNLALNPIPTVAKGLFDFDFLSPSAILTSAPKDYAVESAEWAKDLKGWDLTLSSADKFMNAKDGASDLSAAISTWRNGVYQDAQTKLSALVTGTNAAYSEARAAHDSAVSQATDLQAKIQDRWSKFASSGVPTVADYVGAPITAVTETAKKAYTGAQRAADAVERAVAPTLNSANLLLQYGPWIAGGLGLLYVFSFLPKPSREN